ncbi:hypothetical protein [Microbacterium terregens]|uniref:Uncharacterized protein n=1 Tax=Microbacterium terregens TaxID=69363 RepID=A0ABV5T413_9MICO
MSKQLALAIGAGVLAFAAVVASAASLGTVTSDNLGAGTTVVASCDTVGGVNVSYTTVYDATASQYKVSSVTLSGVDAACNGQAVKISLYGAAGAELGTASGAAVTGANTFTVVAPTPLAQAVTGAAVVISGVTTP